MNILAIDTSCDDTSIAVIKAPRLRSGQAPKKGCFKILSNVVSSQVKLHQKYGGVYPSLAKREHQKNLVPVLKRALKGARLLSVADKGKQTLRLAPQGDLCLEKILAREPELHKKLIKFFQSCKKPKVDAVAVTVGPGLEPCLWVGVNFAKALGFYWNLPIIPVNHIESHILINLLDADTALPAVCLVVSGGHTQLVLMKKIGHYRIIGETRDDAAGECFDKTARVLGLTYPGGPAIAAEAVKGKTRGARCRVDLPRPMLHSKDYDFSFSGLKTAVLYDFKKRPKKQRESKAYVQAMAKEIQQAVIDVLIEKTLQAAKEYNAKTIILGGGVTANKELKKQLKQRALSEVPEAQPLVPKPGLCTDNAAMIGITAGFHQSNKQPPEKLKAKANLRL